MANSKCPSVLVKGKTETVRLLRANVMMSLLLLL